MDLRVVCETEGQKNGWYKLEVKITGDSVDLNKIDHAVYKLHRSFPNPILIGADSPHFSRKFDALGEFLLRAKVVMKDKTEKEAGLWIDLGLPDPENNKKTYNGVFNL